MPIHPVVRALREVVGILEVRRLRRAKVTQIHPVPPGLQSLSKRERHHNETRKRLLDGAEVQSFTTLNREASHHRRLGRLSRFYLLKKCLCLFFNLMNRGASCLLQQRQGHMCLSLL